MNYTQRRHNQAPRNKAWRQRRQRRAVTYLRGETSRVTGTLVSQISGAVRRKEQHFSSTEKKIYLSPSIIYPEEREWNEDILRRRKMKSLLPETLPLRNG